MKFRWLLGQFARLVGLFIGDPDEDNATLRAAEEVARGMEEMRRLRREHDRRIELIQEAKQKAEKEMEDARRRAEEIEEQERLASEKARKAREEAEQVRAAMEEALKRAKEAEQALKRSAGSVEWPTWEEITAAKRMIRYDPKLLHFAVCGPSGSGKSSLVNALRGLTDGDPEAAKVGVVETTAKVTRYIDHRTEMPYARFVWYDVPGTGTLSVPHWEYFIDQGLFVFDFIIMVYGGRFTENDAAILENCRRFQVPVFVVRSKADQEIRNMAVSDGYEEEDDYKPWYEKEKPIYIKQVRENFHKELRKIVAWQQFPDQDLLKERLYIISSRTLRRCMAAKGPEELAQIQGKLIDEEVLVDEILRTAVYRRFEGQVQAAMHSVGGIMKYIGRGKSVR